MDVNNQEMWIFGGYESVGGAQNTLWKYHTESNVWTQLSSLATPWPSVRYGHVLCHDATRTRLVLFSGAVAATNWANDLYSFNLITGLWTYHKGSTSTGVSVTGTTGVEASTNLPGGRDNAIGVIDTIGNYMWVGFGLGYIPTLGQTSGKLNDLWRLNLLTMDWTFIKGSFSAAATNFVGSLGVYDASFFPGSRAQTAGAIDSANRMIYVFGGDYTGANGADLWAYNISSGFWAQLNGPQPGTCPDPSGPLPRFTHALNFDSRTQSLLLFGGFTNTLVNCTTQGYNADLWAYSLTSSMWSQLKNSSLNSNGSGTSFNTYAATNMPGARGQVSSAVNARGQLVVFGGFGNAFVGTVGSLDQTYQFYALPVCAAGTGQAAGCNGTCPCSVSCTSGTSYNDGTYYSCQNCSASISCPAGQGRNVPGGSTTCTATNGKICANCQPGYNYNTGSLDVCTNCSISCAAGTGINLAGGFACNTTADRVCTTCVNGTNYNTGSSINCAPCSTSCSAGMGVWGPGMTLVSERQRALLAATSYALLALPV